MVGGTTQSPKESNRFILLPRAYKAKESQMNRWLILLESTILTILMSWQAYLRIYSQEIWLRWTNMHKLLHSKSSQLNREGIHIIRARHRGKMKLWLRWSKWLHSKDAIQLIKLRKTTKLAFLQLHNTKQLLLIICIQPNIFKSPRLNNHHTSNIPSH